MKQFVGNEVPTILDLCSRSLRGAKLPERDRQSGALVRMRIYFIDDNSTCQLASLRIPVSLSSLQSTAPPSSASYRCLRQRTRTHTRVKIARSCIVRLQPVLCIILAALLPLLWLGMASSRPRPAPDPNSHSWSPLLPRSCLSAAWPRQHACLRARTLGLGSWLGVSSTASRWAEESRHTQWLTRLALQRAMGIVYAPQK